MDWMWINYVLDVDFVEVWIIFVYGFLVIVVVVCFFFFVFIVSSDNV